jgi:hypothetical protein
MVGADPSERCEGTERETGLPGWRHKNSIEHTTHRVHLFISPRESHPSTRDLPKRHCCCYHIVKFVDALPIQVCVILVICRPKKIEVASHDDRILARKDLPFELSQELIGPSVVGRSIHQDEPPFQVAIML